MPLSSACTPTAEQAPYSPTAIPKTAAINPARGLSDHSPATASHSPYQLIRFYLLDFPRRDRLVEPWLERTVQAEDHEPALAGHGLDPVGFLARRSLRTEVDVDRTVGIGDELVALAVPAGKRLAGLQLGARLRIVQHDGPEILRRRIGRDVEPVGLRAVERFAGTCRRSPSRIASPARRSWPPSPACSRCSRNRTSCAHRDCGRRSPLSSRNR